MKAWLIFDRIVGARRYHWPTSWGGSDLPCVLVGELYLQNGWDVARLRQWLPEPLVSMILERQIFPAERDQLVWKGSPSGEFSVSTAWEELRHKRNGSLLCKFIWSSALPKKLSFFVWRLVKNWVPLDDQLQRKGVLLGSRCSCCERARETVGHLFGSGPVASVVWGHFGKQFGVMQRGFHAVPSLLLSWFLSHQLVTANHIRVIVPVASLWFIWRARNHARLGIENERGAYYWAGGKPH